MPPMCFVFVFKQIKLSHAKVYIDRDTLGDQASSNWLNLQMPIPHPTLSPSY